MEPETPAPLFAFRAFKSTIFGSPDDDNATLLRATKPVHHKSTNSTEAKRSKRRTTPTSPTKSILITPGLAGRKSERKVVAFRDAPVRARSPLKQIQLQATTANRGEDELRVPPISPIAHKTSHKTTPSSSPSKPPKVITPLKSKAEPPSSHPTTTASPTTKAYRVRSQREFCNLLSRYTIVRNYARMKDEECSDLAMRLNKLEIENQRLRDQINTNGEDHQKACLCQEHKAREPTSAAPTIRVSPRATSLKVTAVRVPNLPPDRLAAAMARLRVKGEERRRVRSMELSTAA